MDLATAPLRMAQLVLEELREVTALRVTDLQDQVSARVGRDSNRNLTAALELLFLMGLLEYDDSTDAVVLVKGGGHTR